MGKELLKIKIPIDKKVEERLAELEISTDDANLDNLEIEEKFQIVEVECYRSHIMDLIKSGKLDESLVICPSCSNEPEHKCIIQ